MTFRHSTQRLAWLRMVGIAVGLVAATASAQAAPASTPGAPASVHGAWKIVQARTEPLLDPRNARLDLGTDGRLGGHTSCNSMSATFTLDGPQIRIGPVATTRMACSTLQLEQEDRILTALESAVTAIVRDDGLLEIRDSDGRGLLRALRVDAGEPEDPPPQAAAQTGAWPVVGRQGIIKIVIVPTDLASDRSAYAREIADICPPEQSCFINFYSNSSGASISVPLPDAIAKEATAVFRRSVKQAGEFFRWSCRLRLPDSDCF